MVTFHYQTKDESEKGRQLTKTLPTYKKVFTFHSGNQSVEVRIRWSNLCQTIEHEAPKELHLLEEIYPNPYSVNFDGKLTLQAASVLAELQSRINPEDCWTIDEIGLLLNAGGYAIIDGELHELIGDEYH